VRKKGATLTVASKKLFQKVGAIGLVWYWDSHEMLMIPLLMAGQTMHPSDCAFTACVYVEASSKWFLHCCYKFNMILKITKKIRVFVFFNICFLCYKLLRLFTHKYVNILTTVLIIKSM
jgi:hypothetical protein